MSPQELERMLFDLQRRVKGLEIERKQKVSPKLKVDRSEVLKAAAHKRIDKKFKKKAE
jgi:hypothetical protein